MPLAIQLLLFFNLLFLMGRLIEEKRVDGLCGPKEMNEWNDFALVVLAFGGLWPPPAAGHPPKEREQQHKAKEWNGFICLALGRGQAAPINFIDWWGPRPRAKGKTSPREQQFFSSCGAQPTKKKRVDCR